MFVEVGMTIEFILQETDRLATAGEVSMSSAIFELPISP